MIRIIMDTEDLFNKKATKKISRDPEKINIGVTNMLPFVPLTYGLNKLSLPDNIRVSEDSLRENARRLREGEIDLGLVSSIEYALKKEVWHIIPGLCMTSVGKIKHIQLFFKKGLKEIQTIAVDQNVSGEDVLLKILMREKYVLSPEFIYLPADLDNMFAQADAALIIGDKALSNYNSYPARLDLNEEWLDFTGLPFVYAFWVGRELTVTTDEVALIQNSYNVGKNNIQKIAKDYASDKNEDWTFYFDYLNRDLVFTFSEQEKDGLLEFYNYAFFYGYTEFIPDLHFFKS